jgi:hypothetical protein
MLGSRILYAWTGGVYCSYSTLCQLLLMIEILARSIELTLSSVEVSRHRMSLVD